MFGKGWVLTLFSRKNKVMSDKSDYSDDVAINQNVKNFP